MKLPGLLALLLATPLALVAQTAVFTDNFTTGSTTNGTSVPGGTPFASSTSYDIAASKAATTNCLVGGGRFRMTLNASTTSGFVEAQALFTGTPVSLVTVGDYINMTYVFTNTTGTLLGGTTNSYLLQGLFNSGGVPPVAGSLNNSGLSSTSSSFATGNCADWQGYVSRISDGGISEAYTRPLQNGPGVVSANQDLIGNGFGGGTYTNPPGVVFDATEIAPAALTSGSTYTTSYTIALTAAGTLTVTNILYSGAGINPANLIFSQTNTATTTNVLTTSFDGLCIGIRNNSSSSLNPLAELSSITITASIAGSPGPAFNVTGGGVGCPGDSFVVGLTGSVATNTYYLYTNGVLNGLVQSGTGSSINFPAETVTPVPLTNTVVASNTVSGFTGQMSGHVLVSPESAPVVTNQPSPVIAATNSTAVFTVGASAGGLGTLHYQWNLNGSALTDGGNISGSGTPTLVISPVTSADAATTAQGYYCVITNDCGLSTISVTNSLTLDAPANLVWQGGNPNTTWDLATTANFLNGATLVVFHAGDDVIFNDSSSFPNVNISGNFITPTLITNSANSQNYTFSGSGTISGSGALVMSGSSTLVINNANSYSGGTTISSGMVVVSNANLSALGTGPVNLAGGTLYIPLKGSTSLGLSNNINVTASSTLQYVQTGTLACVLSGTLTGNPNQALTVSLFNSSTAFSRLRVYSPFTNNANLVLSSLGTEIEIAPYVSTNSNGEPLNQFFNGVISGSDGHFVPRGAGNVIFNNTNTVSDTTGIDTPTISPPGGVSLLISSGNVGIGADSVASSPPTIDASPVGVGAVAINSITNSEGGSCSLFAYGGAHTIANQFVYTTATNTVTVTFKGSNDLTLSGEFDLANSSDPNGVQRTIEVTNTGNTTLAGTISDNSANNGGLTVSGFTKNGGGSLFLNGTNIYAGPTTNGAGLLAGSGSIAGPVYVSAGSIGGGSAASIGTLTISNNLQVNGNIFIRVNKALSPAQSNDMISVTGTMGNAGTGTVTVTNTGASPLVVGDSFQIFNTALSGGSALTVSGGGVVWNNNLAGNGTISVASIGPSGPTTNASIIEVSLSGTNLVIQGTNNNVPNTSFHYAVLTATNIATPLSNWTPIVTNGFSSNGTFDYTNPIAPGTPQQFIDVKAVP